MESKEAFICSVKYGKTFGVGGGEIMALDCVNLKELASVYCREMWLYGLSFFFFLPRIVIRRLKQYEADEVSLDTNQSGL